MNIGTGGLVKGPGWRRHWPLLAVLFLLVPIYGVWTWTGELGELGSDATDYLVMAQHYAWHSEETVGIAQTAALSRFPPLYPVLLAWSGTATDLHLAHAVTSSFLLAALLVLYVWLQLEEVPAAQAALLILVTAALRETWLTGLLIHSEYLYLLLSLLALALLATFERDRGQLPLLYAAAIAVAAAGLTRTAGLTLFGPLLAVALRARRWRALGALLVAASPVLIWHLLHRAERGYTDALASIYATHPLAALASQVSGQAPALATAFRANFPGYLPNWVIDSLGAVMLGTTLLRCLRFKPDGIYVAGYLAMILVWPYAEVAHRLFWAILPIMLGQCLASAGELERALRLRYLQQAASVFVAGAVLLQALPEVALASDRYRHPSDSGHAEARGLEVWYNPDLAYAVHGVNSQLTVIQALRRLPHQVPPDACIVAVRPVIVTYYTGLKSVFPPLNSVPDPYFDSLLRAQDCHYVFMYSAADGHFPVPLHPLQRLRRPIHILDLLQQHDPAPGTSGMVTILVELD